MPIEIECRCGKRYRVDEKFGGRSVPCKQCGELIRIPMTEVGNALDGALDHVSVPQPRSAYVEPEMPPPRPGTWETQAWNPARLRFRPLLQLTHDISPLIAVGLWVGVAAIFWARGFLISGFVCVVVGLLWQAWQYRRSAARMGYGNVTPAIVVSERPWRIAIYADLTQVEHKDRHAVRVMRAPLHRMTGGPPAIGTPLATVNLYVPGGSDGAWADIDPAIVQLSTRDERQIARVMASIEAESWDKLANYLRHVDPKRDGLYRFWRRADDFYSKLNGTARQAWTIFLCFMVVLYGAALLIPNGTSGFKSLAEQSVPTPRPAPVQPPPASPPIATKVAPKVPIEPPEGMREDFGGRSTPSINRYAIDALGRGGDPKSEKIDVQWNGTWYPARTLQIEGDLVFVQYEGTHRGQWVLKSRLRSR